MIRHPLTLDHITRELRTRLSNAVLITAWTQEKHLVTLGFVLPDNSECYVHINTTHDLGTVLTSTTPNRAKRNSIDLFPELYGLRLLDVTRQPGDRVISLHFHQYILHALLYSTGAGNVVVEGTSGIVDALHNKKQLLGTPFSIEQLPLRLGKHLSDLGDNVEDIAQRYAASTTYYVLTQDDHTLFSAIPLPGWTIAEEHEDVFTALRHAVATRRHEQRTNVQSGVARRELEGQRKKVQRSLTALDTDAQKASSPTELRDQANLLLSKTGVEKDDVERAQQLYQKARRAEAAALEREQRRPRLQKQLRDIEQRLQALEEGDIPDIQPRMTTQQPQAAPPYRTFELEEGYTLYVGRNSANNDQLTMRFAKQNDYWLHVRGQSGSHCVLRSPTPTSSKPPKRVLEQAAAIAAYYSSARNASWTPVVYTLRKHVRKPKGAAVGAVTLEREEVVMVKPGLPSGQLEQP